VEPVTEEWDGEAELEKDYETLCSELGVEDKLDKDFETLCEELGVEDELDRDFEALCQKLGIEDELDEQQEPEAEDDFDFEVIWPDPEEEASPQGPGPFQCTICGPIDTRPLMMKALPGLDGFERRNKAPKRNPAPYCFGCSQEMAAKHLTKTRCRSFPFLGREEARLRVMRYLFSRCWLADISLLCDHYRICRVCLDPNVRVDSPGEHCDAWQDVQCCTSCGQPRRIFLENGDGLFCMPCLRVWRARRGWWRKSKYRRVDPETGALLSRPRRFQCFEPLRRATAKYCSPCRDLLRSRPGKKVQILWPPTAASGLY
jgi:hypothetical protein